MSASFDSGASRSTLAQPPPGITVVAMPGISALMYSASPAAALKYPPPGEPAVRVILSTASAPPEAKVAARATASRPRREMVNERRWPVMVILP